MTSTQVKHIGIVGGGQLARMLTPPALELGFEVTVIDPTPNCPAAQVGANQIEADFKDSAAIKSLAKLVDVVTWESEHIATDTLVELYEQGEVQVEPSPQMLATVQDKLHQKEMLRDAGITIGEFQQISGDDPVAAIESFRLTTPLKKAIVKQRSGGYDGRGNFVVTDATTSAAAVESFGDNILIESFLELEGEISVLAARSTAGEMVYYDPVDSYNQDNICHLVVAPAQRSAEVQQKALALAKQTMSCLEGAGLFAIEMFVTNDGEVLVNEIAPRVHNTGHHTIEACATSQFEQHVRAVTGLGLGSTAMAAPAVMVNLLGSQQPNDWDKNRTVALEAGAHVHWYGKSPSKPARKMGHLTFIADQETSADLVGKAKECVQKIQV